MRGYCIRENPSDPCHPCSKSLRQAFNTIAKNTKLSSNFLCELCGEPYILSQRLNDTNPNRKINQKIRP
jgi:hypothetical protein